MTIASQLLSAASVSAEELTYKIVATTDVHGNFFPYNFITRTPGEGSLARVASRVRCLRDSIGSDHVILLDNGDILQGQPTAYYYNFIATDRPHPVAMMLKSLGYDAETIGNHDVEAGHAVYDRYKNDLGQIPLLGANVIDIATGKPYFKPYHVIERDGIKIVVFGLLTPAIPGWLPENLWSGLKFEDMVESAARWIPVIKVKEAPDLIVGLFHSGHDSSKKTGDWIENASLKVAEEVPGFDIIFMGHDHQVYNSEQVADSDGKSPLVLNPANNAVNLAEAEVKFTLDGRGKVLGKKISGRIVPLTGLTPDSVFMTEFSNTKEEIDNFVNRKIGVATGDFSVRDAYFGPSAFMDLLHDLQLEISGADISFAAPLSFDAVICKGDLHMSDMFTLYKYENMLYTMAMTGREIKNYLEMSYSLWTSEMADPEDHLLLFTKEGTSPAKGDYAKLQNPAYNFDSAAGIIYDVDVTKLQGDKIIIKSMADGSPFDFDKVYKVAVNSYRGNGGGDLLTKGAGIPHEDLKSRILKSTDKDLRYYLIKLLEQRGSITPKITSGWKFIPEELAGPAARKDRTVLFPD